MRKPYLLAVTIGLFVVLGAGMIGCTKKVDAIDNNQVVETPFTVFFADVSGAVYSSNDGSTVTKEVFQADRFPVRALCVAYNNILFAKQNLYISTNNGSSFNHSDDSVASYPGQACDGYTFDLNQSMLLFIKDWNYVYVTNDVTNSANYVGLSFNLYGGVEGDVSNGSLGNWYLDRVDTTLPIPHIGNYNPVVDPNFQVQITSLTLLPNGVLMGYDARHNRCFYRNKNILWCESTGNPDRADMPDIGDPNNNIGAMLPHHNLFPIFGVIDTTARYSYGHYNNELIAYDQLGCVAGGAYYSDDSGRNWKPFVGLPTKPLLCMESPFEEEALIGTQGAGLYMLNNNTHTWQANNNGLAQNCTVRSIVGKERIYKNGRIQKYIFLATDNGIYQSTDGANNWTKVRDGNFTAIY